MSPVEIHDLTSPPPPQCLWDSNHKYAPMPLDFKFKDPPYTPLLIEFQKAVCGMVRIFSGIA